MIPGKRRVPVCLCFGGNIWHNRRGQKIRPLLNLPMPFAQYRPTKDQPAWKHRLYSIIFESDTRAGKAFDVALLIAIGLSITAVMLESVESIRATHADLLRSVEWACTVLFTLEY